MSNKLPAIALLLLCLNLCFSQSNEKTNPYIPQNFEAIKDYLEGINSDFIKKIEGPHSSKIKKIFKDRDEKVVESINDSTYIFNKEILESIDRILKNIYDNNSGIDATKHKFFINTSFIPNAACYGDGMYEVNLGLFTAMKSDDEIAFVLCHEIAHQILDHSLKNVTNFILKINSKETKRKVKDIKKQKYGQTRAALSVIDDLSIDILDHSRETEAQADSLGYVLFSNTDYNSYKAISALQNLIIEDEMLLSHDVKVDSVFNFSTYRFKSFWLKEQTSLFDTTEKIDEFSLSSDTLKTHPEIKYRTEKLQNHFDIQADNNSSDLSEISFLHSISHPESIECSIDKYQLDIAIYLLIEKYNNGLISSEYYVVTMGSVLKQIYQAKKKHQLGKYVPHKNSLSAEKHLNKIRLFLHNLELGETRKMGMAFCDTHKNTLKSNQEGAAIYNFFESINQ